ncbi:hypothetical protein C0J29_31920 (plasmid) [Mycobacterium paragordonae]|nr:hypothetical protein C0J29_31920 [Mycobacterium paragordonae]
MRDRGQAAQHAGQTAHDAGQCLWHSLTHLREHLLGLFVVGGEFAEDVAVLVGAVALLLGDVAVVLAVVGVGRADQCVVGGIERSHRGVRHIGCDRRCRRISELAAQIRCGREGDLAAACGGHSFSRIAWEVSVCLACHIALQAASLSWSSLLIAETSAA